MTGLLGQGIGFVNLSNPSYNLYCQSISILKQISRFLKPDLPTATPDDDTGFRGVRGDRQVYIIDANPEI